MTGLSIVITTFNRAEILASLLGGLANQRDKDFQVVVAIDGSNDGTEDMLASLDLPYEMKWVNTHCDGYGLAVARNLGILASDRDAVAILDDDSFPEPGYVAAHKRSVARGVITGGPRIPADAGNERMAWKMRELAKVPALTPLPLPRMRQEWPNAYLIENNICMFREDFIATGLFSERLKMYGFIGQEFFGRAEYLGMRYQYNPEAGVSHHGEMAGGNGLHASRKVRETRLADLLRPSLMTPDHYLAQVRWAQARANGGVARLPPFLLAAAAAIPWRLARMAAAGAKQVVKRKLKAPPGAA
jgi:glycosyltransferase involved in cell wall biosynthesis